jgi:hypoxanthine-DNA glycosylase
MIRIHSIAPLINTDARVLILGSMPGKVSLARGQYYAHPQNKFWYLIYSVFGRSPDTDYKKKISFLKSRKIALWDVIKECERSGSSDAEITDPMMNEVYTLLNENPNIKYIVFNGHKSEQLFKKYIKSSFEREISFFRLPSSSPANASISLDKKLEAWRLIRDLTIR